MRYDFRLAVPAAVAMTLVVGGALRANEPGAGRLSHNRLTALGQAVRVERLSSAYRADGAAVVRPTTLTVVSNNAPPATLEPGRLPTIVTAQPIAQLGTSATANRPAALPRYDDRVRPSVWIDDRSTPPTVQPVAYIAPEAAVAAPMELNPLRRAAAAYSSGVGNPLRERP